MARCIYCAEQIERVGETDTATIANGDRPWRMVDPPMTGFDGLIGDDVASLEDGSCPHGPAPVVIVSLDASGSDCEWCIRGARYRAMFGDRLVYACDLRDHLAMLVTGAFERQGLDE